MRTTLLLATTLFVGCATVNEENIQYANKCSLEKTDEAVIECHREAIFYKIRAKWWNSTNGLTESDYPEIYNIKTEISVDKKGNILNIKMLSSSNSRKLDRSVLKGIRKSSPLPVPSEPLFSQGDFSVIVNSFVHETGDVAPVFGGMKEMLNLE